MVRVPPPLLALGRAVADDGDPDSMSEGQLDALAPPPAPRLASAAHASRSRREVTGAEMAAVTDAGDGAPQAWALSNRCLAQHAATPGKKRGRCRTTNANNRHIHTRTHAHNLTRTHTHTI